MYVPASNPSTFVDTLPSVIATESTVLTTVPSASKISTLAVAPSVALVTSAVTIVTPFSVFAHFKLKISYL